MGFLLSENNVWHQVRHFCSCSWGKHPLCSEDGFEKALTLTLRDKFKTAWLFLYFAFCCSQRFLLHLTHQTAMVFLEKKEKRKKQVLLCEACFIAWRGSCCVSLMLLWPTKVRFPEIPLAQSSQYLLFESTFKSLFWTQQSVDDRFMMWRKDLCLNYFCQSLNHETDLTRMSPMKASFTAAI